MRLTYGAALLAVAERGRPHRPEAQALGPLLARRVAGLVGVPQLLAVVAELRAAALAAARDLGTAGAAEGDDRVPGGQTHRHAGVNIPGMDGISQTVATQGRFTIIARHPASRTDVHTPTAVSAMRGNGQLVGSSDRVKCLAQGHPARWSWGWN